MFEFEEIFGHRIVTIKATHVIKLGVSLMIVLSKVDAVVVCANEIFEDMLDCIPMCSVKVKP